VIKNLIEQLLKKRHNDLASEKDKKPSLHPSILGDPCFRKKYYSYFRTPQMPREIPSILILENGISTHERIQQWLADTGVAIDYLDPQTGLPPVKNGRPDTEFIISIPELLIEKGKIDRLITLNNELWIVEIKSIGSKKFYELIEPTYEHLVQGTIYLFGFEKCLKKSAYSHIPQLVCTNLQVRGVRFLYVNRDNGQMKEFLVERNEALFIEICKDIQELSTYLSSKELPPKHENNFCRYCPYASYCKKDQNI
jgi:CRISPR/Cas system-associated exonuclease Cas4 (RecB family)